MKDRVFTIEYIIESNIINEAYGFTYITTNLINNKKYIGQKKFDERWRNYLGSGVHFKHAVRKDGIS